MSAPTRFQQRRSKGWRKPAGGICCSRPSRYSNPFTVAQCIEWGFADTVEVARKVCAESFDSWLRDPYSPWAYEAGRIRRETILAGLDALRGRDLGCFCPLDGPCHVDTLLRLANAPRVSSEENTP